MKMKVEEENTENQTDHKQGERNINNEMVEEEAFNEGSIVQDEHKFEDEYTEEVTIIQEVSKKKINF